MVSVPEWLLLTAQWVHLMGAVTWVGGSIFFKFVLQPAFRGADNAPGSMRVVGHEFGKIVRIAIVILVVTGAFMAVVHLTAGGNSRVYIGILALKIALAFYMFLLVWLRRRSAPAASASGSGNIWSSVRRAATSTTALLILGIVVIGLADVLSAVGHGDGGHSHGGNGTDAHAHEAEDSGHMEAADDSHDHPKPEVVVEEETEVAATAEPTVEPTEEAKVEEADGHDHGHGDEEDDHGHGHGDEEDDGHGDEQEEGEVEEEVDEEDGHDHGDGHGHSH